MKPPRPGISPSGKSLPLAEISVEAQEKGPSSHPDRVESGKELQQGEAEKAGGSGFTADQCEEIRNGIDGQRGQDGL